tara:strand:+ start:1698 stop:2522 length:825 start_codon:yes stop_codon:yes gene_type:complete
MTPFESHKIDSAIYRMKPDRAIVTLWAIIVAQAVSRGFDRHSAELVRLPIKPEILGTSSKVEKSRKLKMLTRVIYLSPATESGVKLCPASSPECRAACLGHSSGHLQFDSSRNARLWKSALLIGAPRIFRAKLQDEIERHTKRAHKLGMTPAIRPNGSSDLALEAPIARANPGVKVYGYTKVFAKLASVENLDNAYLTFSYSGRNWIESRAALIRGHNVAVCFADKLPSSWRGFKVIDGDTHDARMLDERGVIVGLKLKGNHDPAEFRPFVQMV